MKALMLGTKDKNLKNQNENAYDAINVMNMIDDVDYIMGKMKDETYYFRDKYEFLCEFAHPNFFGITLGSNLNYKYNDRFMNFYNEPQMSKDDFKMIGDLFIETSSTFFEIYDEVYSLLVEKENIDKLIYKQE